MTVDELIEKLRAISKGGRGNYTVLDEHSSEMAWVQHGSREDDRERRVFIKPEVDW